MIKQTIDAIVNVICVIIIFLPLAIVLFVEYDYKKGKQKK